MLISNDEAMFFYLLLLLAQWGWHPGLELAARPTVLYLDEPTSGLDSTSSLQVINSLSLSARWRWVEGHWRSMASWLLLCSCGQLMVTWSQARWPDWTWPLPWQLRRNQKGEGSVTRHVYNYSCLYIITCNIYIYKHIYFFVLCVLVWVYASSARNSKRWGNHSSYRMLPDPELHIPRYPTTGGWFQTCYTSPLSEMMLLLMMVMMMLLLMMMVMMMIMIMTVPSDFEFFCGLKSSSQKIIQLSHPWPNSNWSINESIKHQFSTRTIQNITMDWLLL